MCFLGLHEWTKWSEPYRQEIIPVDELGRPVAKAYYENRQYRRCHACNKISVRKCSPIPYHTK